MSYQPPLQEQWLTLAELAARPEFAGLALAECVDSGLAASILAESGRFAAEVFAPLDRRGDIEGARWSPARVELPAGFREAYAAWVAGGWGSLGGPAEHGGQALPFALTVAIREQFSAANMALAMNPMLTAGAVAALAAHGSPEQQQAYLPRLVSGEWSAAMDMTEPQAGSDVGALCTAARPAGDGSWRIRGSKIFISWGEHDLADNIIHLVLARTPGAPAGTRGISMFLVPKFLPDGARNDLRCVALEHKLGIRASPTCTMSFGDDDRCVGWLVGAEHGGMRAMFTMMNEMRINVAMQGVAVAERALQRAVGHARERVQSAAPGGDGSPVPIIGHADVRRMLLTLRATTQAGRALVCYLAAEADRARVAADAASRQQARARVELLTPVAKAHATDLGVAMASLAIQVFGGVGYVEETGAAQLLRDARIGPIYEGTNGIQALDFVGRKLPAGDGAHWRGLLDEIEAFAATLAAGALRQAGAALAEAAGLLRQATGVVAGRSRAEAAAVATPCLRMWGIGVAGYLLLRQAAFALERLPRVPAERAFLEAKLATARFYAAALLPETAGLHRIITGDDAALLWALDDEQFTL